MPPKNQIEKAIKALANAGVEVGANERAVDVEVPQEKSVAFEPDVDINELPDDHKTRKNIILTRKITHNLDDNNPNVSSEFQTYIFLT